MDILQVIDKAGFLGFLAAFLFLAAKWFAPRVDKVIDATSENATNLKVMEATAQGRHKEIIDRLEDALRLLRGEEGK